VIAAVREYGGVVRAIARAGEGGRGGGEGNGGVERIWGYDNIMYVLAYDRDYELWVRPYILE